MSGWDTEKSSGLKVSWFCPTGAGAASGGNLLEPQFPRQQNGIRP